MFVPFYSDSICLLIANVGSNLYPWNNIFGCGRCVTGANGPHYLIRHFPFFSYFLSFLWILHHEWLKVFHTLFSLLYTLFLPLLAWLQTYISD